MSHQCKALVIHCLDFRLGKAIKKYLEEKNLLGDCDIISVAGAAKNLSSPEKESERDFLFKQIDISQNLHRVSEIILINHTDCGAYGGSSAFRSKEEERRKYFEDMGRAAKIILEKYPELNVKTILADIDENGVIAFLTP